MISPDEADPPSSSPRISFSADFLNDDAEFFSISPSNHLPAPLKSPDFEFLSATNSTAPTQANMLTADQLFSQGKFLPSRQPHHPEETPLKDKADSPPAPAPATSLSTAPAEPRIWFIDDDPSPRPPKCTVLWKELLRLRKNKSTAANSLSPSSSSSSSSSASSSLGDHAAAIEEGKKRSVSGRERHVRRIKKGLERTIKIRPMVNVPISTASQGTKSGSLPPLFPLKKRQTAS